MSLVIAVLARQAARKAVKRQLQAEGRKVSQMAAKEITALAEAYLRNHPEMIAPTAETVRKVPQLRTLAEREERQRRRNRR